MKEVAIDPSGEGSEPSILALASVLLRWRRVIIAFGIAGGVAGLASGLASPRLYQSGATFVPQGAEGSVSGLAAAASQLGIRIPSGGGTVWGPPMYVELLRSHTLLEPLARDTLTVAELGRRRMSVVEIMEVEMPSEAERIEETVRKLKGVVSAHEVKSLAAVKVTVTTEYPSVSYGLAERLLQRLNHFNLEVRKSQAAAERQFVTQQAAEAERAMRDAESRLQLFLQRNRAIGGSPELGFERDRLQREVNLRQQVFSSLMQSREEAKIREVRDTPVITVVERPRHPVVGLPRNSIQKAIIGGIAGGMLAVFLAVIGQAVAGAKKGESQAARTFVEELEAAKPRFLRRQRA